MKIAEASAGPHAPGLPAAASSASGLDHGVTLDDHAATRTKVVRSLVDAGPATAAALAERLGLTPGGVRRHLDALSAEGKVQAADEPPYGPRTPRRRGRPAKVYSVTEAGRAAGATGDAALAREALRHLRATLGDDGIRAFSEARLADQQRRYSAALADVPLAERARVLAELLTSDGFAASVDEVPGTAIGIQICQHDCPVAQVAAEFPELCDAESRMFADVLGTHVQRLATLAHGDGVCTTHMPAVLAAVRSAPDADGVRPHEPSSQLANSSTTPSSPLDRSTR